MNDDCFCEDMRRDGYREVCDHCIGTKDWSRGPTPVEIAAQGIEAGTAETERLGPTDESPVAESDAPKGQHNG